MLGTIEFPYRLQIGKALLGIMFFGFGALFSQNLALTNDRGLIIDGIFRLDVNEADKFYWAMAIFCFAFASAILVFTISSTIRSTSLRLTENELYVPHGIFLRTRKIPFNTIFSARLLRVRRAQFLEIRSENGKVTINPAWLPTGAFDQVCALVTARTRALQTEIIPARNAPSPEKPGDAPQAKAGMPARAAAKSFKSAKKSFGRKS